MIPFLRIPYAAMNFVWISSHYDIHLSGLCRVNGELMRFKTEESHLCYPWRNLRCHVFTLTPWERFCWTIRQKSFEVCVGKHWTYQEPGLLHRGWNPSWLHRNVLTPLYYHFTMPLR